MTKGSVGYLTGIASLTAATGFLIGTRTVSLHIFAMMVGFVALAFLLGHMSMKSREPWLPGLMALAMIAKLLGSSIRYYVLAVIYSGSGDGGRYHSFGLTIADTWRNLEVPDLATVAFGSQGTRFTAWITGLLYGPYEPSALGGFWYFALIAFVGQFFFYLAFRKSASAERWKRYAILIFFWPTLVYWPSSIGKEALLILFLGVGTWAAAHLFHRYELRWLLAIAAAAFLASMVRMHVAAIFAAAIIGAVVLDGRKRQEAPPLHNRLLILLIVAVAALPLALGVADQFGVNLENIGADDLDPVFSDVGDMTGQGGSVVSGGVIRTPLDIPSGVLKVLFRPLPNDARNLQMLVASLEGLALLSLMTWQATNMFRNRGLIRRSPYMLYSLIFSGLFIWAWSAVLNLGILARQRSLVLPFVLVLVAGLGWSRETSDPSRDRHDRDSDVLPASRIGNEIGRGVRESIS